MLESGRCLALLSILALLATARAQDAVDPARGPINAVIGDASFAHVFGDADLAASAGEDLRIAVHLAYVERLLQQREVSAWPAELQRERQANLERLHAYRERAVFPRNHDHPEQRRPCFIDRDGRICAVGYLVEQSAGRELAEAINSRFQYAMIAEMADERLDGWVGQSGLTLRELATIQPNYCSSWPASASAYGASCAPAVSVAPYVVQDPASHFGLGGFPPLWWSPAPSGAQWIGSAQLVAPGTYTLTQTFDLTGFDPGTAWLSGLWSANPGSSILLNGVATGVPLPVVASPLPFTIQSGFVPGINVLEFRVPTDFSYSFFGLLVANLGGAAQRNGIGQPIPNLFDTGVDAQGVVLPGGVLDPHYRSDEPPLRAVGRPIVLGPGFAVTIDAAPNRNAVLLVSLGQGWGIPIGSGCEILVDPNSMVGALFGQTDARGIARFPLPVPWLGGWCGPSNLDFYGQGVVEDPASPLGGLSLTQGLWMQTGW
jgi:hypothetical protein